MKVTKKTLRRLYLKSRVANNGASINGTSIIDDVVQRIHTDDFFSGFSHVVTGPLQEKLNKKLTGGNLVSLIEILIETTLPKITANWEGFFSVIFSLLDDIDEQEETKNRARSAIYQILSQPEHEAIRAVNWKRIAGLRGNELTLEEMESIITILSSYGRYRSANTLAQRIGRSLSPTELNASVNYYLESTWFGSFNELIGLEAYGRRLSDDEFLKKTRMIMENSSNAVINNSLSYIIGYLNDRQPEPLFQFRFWELVSGWRGLKEMIKIFPLLPEDEKPSAQKTIDILNTFARRIKPEYDPYEI